LWFALDKITNNEHWWYHRYYLSKWNSELNADQKKVFSNYCKEVRSSRDTKRLHTDAYCVNRFQTHTKELSEDSIQNIWMSRVAFMLLLIKSDFYVWNIDSYSSDALKWLFTSTPETIIPVAPGNNNEYYDISTCNSFRHEKIQNPYACSNRPQSLFKGSPYGYDVIESFGILLEAINHNGGIMPRTHREMVFFLTKMFQNRGFLHGPSLEKPPALFLQHKTKTYGGCRKTSLFYKAILQTAIIPTVNFERFHSSMYFPSAGVGVTHSDSVIGNKYYPPHIYFRTKQWHDKYMWMEQCASDNDFETNSAWYYNLPYTDHARAEFNALSYLIKPELSESVLTPPARN